jgi:hypothetical protein
MAKIQEEILVIKISTLLPDTCDMTDIMDADNISALQAVIQEMAGDNRTLVEIEKANN